VPIINAGDGSGEHPTQALLDLYTITKEFDGVFDDRELRITFIGDLRYGRTVHSLSLLLRNFPHIHLTFVAPDGLGLPEEYRREGDTYGHTLSSSVLSESDVIYMTRVQKERFPNVESYEAVKNAFVFDVHTVSQMKSTAILMHPLPRVNEISLEIDDLPQARYFEQAKNGVPVRMALIKYCLEK
jgi:aspartate carbamoyltransferase catalytic subunit